jgi:hypothetical protein
VFCCKYHTKSMMTKISYTYLWFYRQLQPHVCTMLGYGYEPIIYERNDFADSSSSNGMTRLSNSAVSRLLEECSLSCKNLSFANSNMHSGVHLSTVNTNCHVNHFPVWIDQCPSNDHSSIQQSNTDMEPRDKFKHFLHQLIDSSVFTTLNKILTKYVW